MKKNSIAFFNKPLLVGLVSLMIAGTIGAVVYRQTTLTPEQHLVKVTQGNISENGVANMNQNSNHVTLAFLASGRIETVSVKVGDTVKKDDILASLQTENTAGVITQAQAAYAVAQANYKKVLNGATEQIVAVSQAAVASAQSSLSEITTEQSTLVENARRKLYSDNLIAESQDKDRRDITPTVSGVYNGKKAGSYRLYFENYNVYSSNEVSYDGLEHGILKRSDLSQPLGTNGLRVSFPDVSYNSQDEWIIDIPNKNGQSYTTNLNNLDSALKAKDQSIASAKAKLTQAEASLQAVDSTARPEDIEAAEAAVASAEGTLQIAQSTYQNQIIEAPRDGTISAVYISAGQIAAPNAPAIELSGTTTPHTALLIPKSAVISKNGKYYVQLQTTNGIVEKEITIGNSDNLHTEVTSGLSMEDEVVAE